jgi:2-dehydropantoate 2-reductase
MRTLVVGAGVNGTLAAAALAEAGADVTVLTRPERQKQLLMAQTKITSPLGRFSKPLHAVTPKDLAGQFDAVILATRANLFQASLFAIRDVIMPATLLVPLFDGVHHLQHWRECFRDNPVAIARFNVRAEQDADGFVRQNGPVGDLKLGLISTHGAEQLEALCGLLDGRRFRAAPHGETVATDVWARAVYRAAAAGACQLSGMSLRDTLRFDGSATFKAMISEGIRAGEARGMWQLLHPAIRYRTAFLRDGDPVSAPAPIAAGGRAGSEALFLLASMLRQAQDAKVAAPALLRAWQATAAKVPALQEMA